MASIVDYEEAQGEAAKALAALSLSEGKGSKAQAWIWAEKAAEHAKAAGIEAALQLLGNGRWPEFADLKKALEDLKKQEPKNA